MRSWLLDRLVMAPTRDPIDAGNKRRETLELPQGEAEIWIESCPTVDSHGDRELLVIKFPGTGGRAERASAQPADLFENVNAEVWSVNPPGYGRARGRATLSAALSLADCLAKRLQGHSTRKILLVANSLGNLTALRLAAEFHVHGLLLRNPPPIPQVVHRRSRHYRAGWFGRWVSSGFPAPLDPSHNASRCRAPAVFVHSQFDQLVPLEMQQQIAQAYAGPSLRFIAKGCDHADPIPEGQTQEYLDALQWLGNQLWSETGCRVRLPSSPPGDA